MIDLGTDACPEVEMTLRKLAWWGSHRLATGSPDVRGWRVLDEAGAELGVIVDLIFDDENGLARYVGLRVAGEKVLVPVAALELRPCERVAVVSGGPLGLVAQREENADDRHQG